MMDVKLHLLNLVQGHEQLVIICLAKKFLFIDHGGFVTVPSFRNPMLEPT
jgi:hypothetical protein